MVKDDTLRPAVMWARKSGSRIPLVINFMARQSAQLAAYGHLVKSAALADWFWFTILLTAKFAEISYWGILRANNFNTLNNFQLSPRKATDSLCSAVWSSGVE